MTRKFLIKTPNIITSTVTLYILMAVLAPVAKYFNWDNTANLIYFIYSFLCHQKDTRSLHILGEKMAFCTRDLGIFIPIAVIGILSLFPKVKFPNLNWKIYAVLVIPLIADGTTQLASKILQKYGTRILMYESTNALRLITGAFFGIAVGSFIFQTLSEVGRK